jgi:hypothetical protein
MMEDPLSISSEKSSRSSPKRDSALSSMSAWELAEHCRHEMSHHRCGDPSGDQYGIELFRRATRQDDEARTTFQHCFSETVRGWLHQHPGWEMACYLDTEDHYVALAFVRCWQSTIAEQLEFGQLSGVLHYLRACLNGGILDTLRAYSRLKKVSLQEPEEPGKHRGEESTDSSEVWETLKNMLSNPREQQLAYLLFHCGLKPREIVRFYSDKFSEVQEIYGLLRNLMERLIHLGDQIH